MANPFVAEIRLVPFNFAPKGWAFCDGRLMSISQNTALFSLLGTFYGGDGKSTFALPNLQGSTAIGQNDGVNGLSRRVVGESGGADSVALLPNEIPQHTHQLFAANQPGTTNSPNGAALAIPRYGRAIEAAYSATAGSTTMSPLTTSVSGSGSAHNNLPPYLVLNYIIALQGVYPPRA